MMKNIFMVAFLLLTNVQAEFVRNDVLEVVNDTTTCLMWQDDLESQMVHTPWAEAIEHCEELIFAKFDDWRLPNSNELYSISDRSRGKYNPAIKDSFVNGNRGYYWSSTTFSVNHADSAWVVDFIYGRKSTRYKWRKRDGYDSYWVRCVRGGQ